MADPLAFDHAVMARHISDLQLQVANFKTSVESIPALLPSRSSRSASSTDAKQAAAVDLRSDTVISLLASIPVIIDKTLAAIQTLSNSMHTLESYIQRSSNSGAQLASRLHALEARDAKLRPEMEFHCRNILAARAREQPKVESEADSDDDEETEEPPDQDSSSSTTNLDSKSSASDIASRLASMESLLRSLDLYPSSSSMTISTLSRPYYSTN